MRVHPPTPPPPPTPADALALAGCDYLVINSKIMAALDASPTMQVGPAAPPHAATQHRQSMRARQS